MLDCIVTMGVSFFQFCSGTVTIHSVPGRHVSFLKGSFGDQVAGIINGIVSPDKAN